MFLRAEVLEFAKSFLKHLTKTRQDTRHFAFEILADRPKIIQERRDFTSRIVTKHDIESVGKFFSLSKAVGTIDKHRATRYHAFILFGAYLGQRPMATIARPTVGQFHGALRGKSPAYSCSHINI